MTATTPASASADEGMELRCPACDYDLRAMSSDRCPECGLLIDRAALAGAQIPWTFRKGMGRWRAYRKTVTLAALEPHKLALEVARPVSFADARRFQQVTILIALVPVFSLFLWSYFAAYPKGTFSSGRPHGSVLGWILEAIGLMFAAGCLWLFLFCATGVGSYFFHPRDLSVTRQNRAIALSYYACAPLAWTWAPALLVAALMFIAQSPWSERRGTTRIVDLLVCFLLIAGVFEAAAWWRSSIVLLRRTTGCGIGRATVLGIFLPFAYSVLGLLFLGLLPLIYIGLAVMILSLR